MSYTNDQVDTYGQMLAVLAHHLRTRKVECDAALATAVASPAKGFALLHRAFVANKGLEGPGEAMLVALIAELPELPAHLPIESQGRVWLAHMRHLGVLRDAPWIVGTGHGGRRVGAGRKPNSRP